MKINHELRGKVDCKVSDLEENEQEAWQCSSDTARVVAVVFCLVHCLAVYLEFGLRQIATAQDWEAKGLTVVFSMLALEPT